MGISSSYEYTPKYKPKNYYKQFPGKKVYKIDNKAVYWRGERVNEASGETFVDYGEGYGEDDSNVYYKSFIMNTKGKFKVLGHKYAMDSMKIYYKGKEIMNADKKTFKIYKNGTVRDKNYEYIYGKKK
jgi:uncharacterized membrane protein YvbJ